MMAKLIDALGFEGTLIALTVALCMSGLIVAEIVSVFKGPDPMAQCHSACYPNRVQKWTPQECACAP